MSKVKKDKYAINEGFLNWKHLVSTHVSFDNIKGLDIHINKIKSLNVSEFEKIKGYSSNFFSIKDWEDFDLYIQGK